MRLSWPSTVKIAPVSGDVDADPYRTSKPQGQSRQEQEESVCEGPYVVVSPAETGNFRDDFQLNVQRETHAIGR
jgi:hypothetical protein